MTEEQKQWVDSVLTGFKNRDIKVQLPEVLGSCQYKPIEDAYYLCKEIFDRVGIKGLEEALQITHKGYYTREEFERLMYEDFMTWYQWNMEYHESKLQPHLDAGKISIEDYYNTLRNISSDLWSAWMRPIKDFKMGLTMEPWGTENIEIGIGLFYHTYLYGIDLSLFANFDT